MRLIIATAGPTPTSVRIPDDEMGKAGFHLRGAGGGGGSIEPSGPPPHQKGLN